MRVVNVLCALLLLSACALEFKSDQYTMLKSLISGDKRSATQKQWAVFFEGGQNVAYAVEVEKGVRFMSMNHLEVDFSGVFVTGVRVLSPAIDEYSIVQTQAGAELRGAFDAEAINVSCLPLQRVTEFEYIQQCRNGRLAWRFKNELKVNVDRNVVYIKTHYSPSKPPLEMYHSSIFSGLDIRPSQQ